MREPTEEVLTGNWFQDEEMEDADQEEKKYTMHDMYGTPSDSDNEAEVGSEREEDEDEDQAEFRALEADFRQAQEED